MTRYTLLTLASLGLAACTVGCQNSGGASAEAEIDRPRTTYTRTETRTDDTSMQAGATVRADASTYTIPYVTSRETQYMTSATASTPAGTLRSGETVYLRSAPSNVSSTEMIPARTADGRTVYVRATDLRPR